MLRWLTERRRRHLLETPFPDGWRQPLEERVAAYHHLDATHQQRLRDLVQVFIAEKHWEGCGGLELTDEMRVTIAGSACLMLLARDHDLFAEVLSILVYPSTVFLPPSPEPTLGSGAPRVVTDQPVIGLSHHHGPVVLAWDAVLAGAANRGDGRNVVVHEFAHKIDDLDGRTDGTPPLPDRARVRAWVAAFAPAFLAQRDRVARGEPSFLRDYATQSEAEFFAVASEAYFEKPEALREALPDVHAELRRFYGYELPWREAERP
jgi:Mlc titration factor MtfA (ptsG expression regulator)